MPRITLTPDQKAVLEEDLLMVRSHIVLCLRERAHWDALVHQNKQTEARLLSQLAEEPVIGY